MSQTEKKDSRRTKGDGSIYFREDKDLWVAIVEVGRDGEGKRKRKTIYGKTKAEVMAQKKELEVSIATGMYLEPLKITVGEYMTQWLEEVCKPTVREKTYYGYESVIRCHITPELGAIRLQHLTPMQVQAFYNNRLATGLSPKTVRNIHNVLHRALKQAARWDYIKVNVTQLVDPPKYEIPEMMVLNQDEVEVFLNAAKDDSYYPLYVTALTTGLRAGELIGLQWKNVDLRDETLSVQRTIQEVNGRFVEGPPKSKASRRIVTLPKKTVRVLKEHRISQLEKGFMEEVSTDSQGNYVRLQNLTRRSFKPLLKEAKVSEIRFHDLRHTHATLLLKQDINPKLVQERLGHSSIALTLDTYSHVLPSMQRAVANELNLMFG